MAATPQSPATRGSAQRGWFAGVDSFSVPDQLGPQEIVMGHNLAIRGGLLQTRPGSRSIFCLPDGTPQGACLFTPSSGAEHLVVAIAGRIYVSPAPFVTYTRLAGIQFWASSRSVTFASCLKSTDYTSGGELFFLDREYRVLVIQDGRTRAAYWDGSTAAHLNPTESPGEFTQDGYDGTKIGLHMVWSGSRLWVSRGNRIFASDIGNPLKFTEAQYLNEAPAFYLPTPCTGIIETPEKDGIIAFHGEGGDFFQSSLLDRTQWLQTANFQRTVISVPNVAPRSLIKQHGFIWWFSPAGLINLNEALRENISSEITPVDQEMAWSKAKIGPDLSGICCAAFENYLLVSVPFCSLQNTHTWSMDLNTFEQNQRAWDGVWTGWQPVEWVSGLVSGRQRCFCLSADADGHNRMWETFLGDRRDNGCEITCSAQLRLDPLGSAERKKYQFAELDLAQVSGEVSIMAAVAGWRGWFQRVLTKEMVATDRRISKNVTYGDGTTNPKMGGNRPQVRTLRTENWTNPDACNECGVESDDPNNLDTHFQLLVAWSGQCALLAVRQFAIDDPRGLHGRCEASEEGERTLKDSGCGGKSLYPDGEGFPAYAAKQTVTTSGENNTAEVIEVTAYARSQISQRAADRKALCHATRQASAIAQETDEVIADDINVSNDRFAIRVVTSNSILYDSDEIVTFENEEAAEYG